MRCVAYCTAENYRINKIAELFKQQGYEGKFFRNVLYLYNKGHSKEIFFFNLGAFVTWNLTSRGERSILSSLESVATAPLPQKEIDIDRFVFAYSKKTLITVHQHFDIDLITLEDRDPQIKLAISYGLAQSVKLNTYEESVAETMKKNSNLFIELARYGKISLGANAISRRMGEIFLERSAVNLSSGYLDMPQYFWQYPSLYDYYAMTEKYLDLTQRTHSLNRRLDVFHDLFNILNTQLQNRHSNMLEIVIVLLIFIEIIMEIIRQY